MEFTKKVKGKEAGQEENGAKELEIQLLHGIWTSCRKLLSVSKLPVNAVLNIKVNIISINKVIIIYYTERKYLEKY